MLLVDHGKRQRLEVDVLLDQRLGPDDEIDLAAFDGRQQIAASRGCDPPGEKRDAIRLAVHLRSATERQVQCLDDRSVMLFGKNLRRRHECDLVAVLDRHDRREQRHYRLAGADVALQEPLHGPRALHIRDDFGERVALSFRQLERQHRAGTLTDTIVDPRHEALAHLRILVTTKRQPRLEHEEVLEHQPPLRRRHERIQLVDVRILRRKMRRPQCRLAAGPALAPEDVGRNGIEFLVRQLRERLPHEAPLHVGRDAASPFVDRNDATGVQLHFFRFPVPDSRFPVPVP